MSFIELHSVTKEFPGGTRAVDAVDLDVEQGEFLVLVGPSGCGKTTLLRMIAGLEETTSGSIVLGGRDVTHLDPGDRDVAMVFQSYALYPHMTVYDNLSFGMRMAGKPKKEIETRVLEAARFLQLSDLLKRKPAQLSGGQRQRVAMGRAIVRSPNAFLMDEPLSNLDAKLRVEMRAEVSRIQREIGVTTVYVTHDQVEAMTMGDRVAVLNKGRLQQVASPTVLYDEPANLFVAGFLGSPSMSVLEAGVESTGSDGCQLRLGKQVIPLEAKHTAMFPRLRELVGGRIAFGIRSENVHLASDAVAGRDDVVLADLPGTVILTEMLGSEEIVHASVDAPRLSASQLVAQLADVAPEASQDAVSDTAGRRPTLVAKTGRRDAIVRMGSEVTLAVDRSRIYLFDMETGASLRA